MAFDYKKLLLAYINHIGEIEGTDFLGKSADHGINGLEADEIEELRRVSKEADKLYQ